MSPNTRDDRLLKKTRLILWDEVPMATSYAITIVSQLLRDVTDYDQPVGCKTIVFGGDFTQVLPVVPHASRTVLIVRQ